MGLLFLSLRELGLRVFKVFRVLKVFNDSTLKTLSSLRTLKTLRTLRSLLFLGPVELLEAGAGFGSDEGGEHVEAVGDDCGEEAADGVGEDGFGGELAVAK